MYISDFDLEWLVRDRIESCLNTMEHARAGREAAGAEQRQPGPSRLAQFVHVLAGPARHFAVRGN